MASESNPTSGVPTIIENNNSEPFGPSAQWFNNSENYWIDRHNHLRDQFLSPELQRLLLAQEGRQVTVWGGSTQTSSDNEVEFETRLLSSLAVQGLEDLGVNRGMLLFDGT